jgi:hypothetical protein
MRMRMRMRMKMSIGRRVLVLRRVKNSGHGGRWRSRFVVVTWEVKEKDPQKKKKLNQRRNELNVCPFGYEPNVPVLDYVAVLACCLRILS